MDMPSLVFGACAGLTHPTTIKIFTWILIGILVRALRLRTLRVGYKKIKQLLLIQTHSLHFPVRFLSLDLNR
jgi:hypothetical protein